MEEGEQIYPETIKQEAYKPPKLIPGELAISDLEAILEPDSIAILEFIDACERYNEDSSRKLKIIMAFWLAVHLENALFVSKFYESFPLIKLTIDLCLNRKSKEGEVSMINISTSEGNLIGQRKTPFNNIGENNLLGRKEIHIMDEYMENVEVKELSSKKSDQDIRLPTLADILEEMESGNQLKEESKEMSHTPMLTQNINNSQSKIRIITDEDQRNEPSKTQIENGISGDPINNKICNTIKYELKHNNTTLMTNILKIALNHLEEKIACIIVSEYEVNLTHIFIAFAIKSGQFEFLKAIWMTGKNFFNDNRGRAKILTHQYLIDKIRELCPNDDVDRIRLIMKWNCPTRENTLLILLSYHMDILINERIYEMAHMANFQTLLYAMENKNESFLRMALVNNIYDPDFLSEAEFLGYILKCIRTGHNIFIASNVILYAEFKNWNANYLKLLLAAYQDLIYTNYEKCKLIFLSNPILTLSITAEVIFKISKAAPVFENKCEAIGNDYIKLANTIIENITEESIFEKGFLAFDFKGRNMFEIVTNNKFHKLFSDEKVDHLLNILWEGKDHSSCSGRLTDYSQLSYLLLNPSTVGGNKITTKQLIENNFRPKLNLNYSFQYRFRKPSVNFVYYEDFLFSTLFLIIFQMVNFKYLELFSSSNFTGMTDTEKEGKIRDNIEEYQRWNIPALVMTCSLGVQILLKILYNVLSGYKLSLDRWTFIDLLTFITNFIAILVISNLDPEVFMSKEKKYNVDYYMIAVVIVAWFRFFMMLLLNKHISPMLNALLIMIIDTASFLCIFAFYTALVASIFFTLYIDTDTAKYGNYLLAARTTFDISTWNYDYDMDGREVSYSILVVLHLSISGIFLVNYLIALLTTVYELTKETGDFYYKANVCYYCEKYNTPLKDRVYGELVYNPAPVCLMSLFLLPFICSTFLMVKAANLLGILIFWIQNIIFMLFFLTFHILLVPFIWLKVFFTIGSAPTPLLSRIKASAIWFFLGIFLLLLVAFKDLFRFAKLLIRQAKMGIVIFDKEEEEYITDQIDLINEIMGSMRDFYTELANSRLRDKNMLESDFEDSFSFAGEDVGKGKKLDIRVGVQDIIERWKMDKRKIYDRKVYKRELGEEINNSKSASDVFRRVILKAVSTYVKQEEEEGIIMGKQMETIDTQDLLDKQIITETELRFLTEFISKFQLMSPDLKEHIDLYLTLSILPKETNRNNIDELLLYNFQLFQESLIQFQNEETSDLFNQYDKKNNKRIWKLKTRIKKNDANLMEATMGLREISNHLGVQKLSKKESIGSSVGLLGNIIPESQLK